MTRTTRSTIALAFLLTACSIANAVSKASAFDEANKRSVEGLSALPRGPYPDKFKGTSNMTYQLEYLKGIGVAVSIFFIFGFLGILICPPWCCCRTFHCCCCKRTKFQEQQGFLHKWGFFLFIILNCLLMISFGAIAYDANGRFSEAIVHDDDGMLAIGSTVLEDMRDFVDIVVFEPLDFIKVHTVKAINNVSRLLDGSEVIVNGTGGIVASLYQFEEDWSNYTINITSDSGNTYQFPCSVCTSIGQVVGDTAQQMDNETQSIFDALSETITGIQEELIAVNSSLLNELSNASAMMRDLTDELDDITTDYNEDTRPAIEGYNGDRELAYNILFVIPLIPFIPVLLGGLLQISCCFTFAYSMMWLSFIIMFILMGFHLIVAILLNDACTFLDNNDDNLAEGTNETTMLLAAACMNNSKVAEVFGFDEFLEFVNIPFPELNSSEITDAFDFSELDGLDSELNNSAGLDVFGGLVDAGLAAINNLTAWCTCPNPDVSRTDFYTRRNLSNLTASDYYNPNSIFDAEVTSYETLWNLTNLTLDIMSAEESGAAQFDIVVNGIQSDLGAIQNQTDELEDDVVLYFDRINDAEKVLDPIFRKAEEVIDLARCGFIGDAYDGLKENICVNIVASLSTMVLCMLLIGIFSFLSCIFSIKMVRRIKPKMDKDYDETVSRDGTRTNTKPSAPATPVIMLSNNKNPQYTTSLYAKK